MVVVVIPPKVTLVVVVVVVVIDSAVFSTCVETVLPSTFCAVSTVSSTCVVTVLPSAFCTVSTVFSSGVTLATCAIVALAERANAIPAAIDRIFIFKHP
jgi:hypothetical protein